MATTTARLTDDALAFLSERHLAMLTTLRADNSPHVVAVGFTFDPRRISRGSNHQRRLPEGRQRRTVPGWRYSARSTALGAVAGGPVKVSSDADAVRDAELRYAQRYRTPRPNPRRWSSRFGWSGCWGLGSA